MFDDFYWNIRLISHGLVVMKEDYEAFQMKKGDTMELVYLVGIMCLVLGMIRLRLLVIFMMT